MEQERRPVAVPGETDVVVPEAYAELIACLDVLAEFLDRATTPTEFMTAIAQICELVPLLLQENEAAWQTLDALKAQAVAVAQTGNRETRRAMNRTSSGIVLPR